MKQCTRCKKLQELSAFYRHPTKKSGRDSHCKECRKIYFQTPERQAIHSLQYWKYRQTPKGKATTKRSNTRYQQTEKYKVAIEKYRKKYPERRKANILLTSALQCGRIIRPNTCITCKKACTPQAHHPNYSKPLEVIWLCHSCHMILHWSAYSKYGNS